MEILKLVVVGDGAIGKSSLLIAAVTGAFPDSYVPTVFDNYTSNVVVNGEPFCVAFWDTAGQEDYDRLRPLAYPNTDVCFICFSIDNRESLQNAYAKWYAEINHYMPTVTLLLVGCKADLRNPDNPAIVTRQEAERMAKQMHAEYYETSALQLTGLKECINGAVLATISKKSAKKSPGGVFTLLKPKKKETRQPPIMPPAGKAPWLEVKTSTFADNWQRMLEDPRHVDVTFIVEGKHHLKAHKAILTCASNFFRRVLRETENNRPNQLDKFTDEAPFTDEELNSGQVLGISRVYEEVADDKSTMTFIELSADISGKTFSHVLQFLYTGLPTPTAEMSVDDIRLLIEVCRTFSLPHLETICVNQENEDEFLNPSIGTFLNDEIGQKMKKMYLNNRQRADISFKVEGQQIWANKAILTARCEVMAAMFSGHFAEGSTIAEIELFDTTAESFLSLLEYLYTDHAPIEDSDSIGILVLANQYCQPRLVSLCELYITKEVERACSKNIQKSDIDVIGTMLVAQLHNAEQLANWCLHFISTNYQAFSKRQEFALLTGTNLEYVQEHQWPPVSYIQAVQQYEKEMEARGEKCAVM